VDSRVKHGHDDPPGIQISVEEIYDAA